MLFIHLAILFFGSVQISVSDSNVRQFHSKDFVFPLEKSDDFTPCTFKNGTVGGCVNLSVCPNARDDYRSGINPTLCGFDKEEPVVCCMKEVVNLPIFDPFVTSSTTEREKLSDDVERRKSAAKCDDFFTPPVSINKAPGLLHVSVVGGSFTLDAEFPHMVRITH